MPQTQELIDWLVDTIKSLPGAKWQITLNSDGTVVEATAKAVQSERNNGRGHSTTITKVTTQKFVIGESKRKVFSTD